MQEPRGVVALSVFFGFGTLMASLACAALIFPQSSLSAIWRLNPEALESFQDLGPWSIALMAVVSSGCALASVGLWQGVRWGWGTAVTLLFINVLGNAVNAAVRGDMRPLIGIPIGGGMLAYLLSRPVRKYFVKHNSRVEGGRTQ